MLSNQGQAVNLCDGSPLYFFNFTHHGQQGAFRGERAGGCVHGGGLYLLASPTLKYYVNQNNDTTIFCGCGDAPDHKP